MTKKSSQLSRSLEAVSKALARWTVERHATDDPSLPRRYGAGWQADWVANVEARLAYLAQAIAVRCPDVFSSSMLWNRDAITRRDGRVDDLQASLRHLRAVIADELPSPVARVATECVDAALAALDQPHTLDSIAADDTRHRNVRLHYLECLLSSKRHEAITLVLGLSRSGVPVTEIYTSVLEPAQAEIGRMWHRNEISIADEHYATSVTQEVMSRLRANSTAAKRRDVRVVAAAVGGDFHEIGIRMVADCFELDGWDVAYLGANLPAFEAVREVRERKASLLALSASTFLHLRDAGELIAALRAEPECAHAKAIIGGPPFNLIPDLWHKLGADGHARTAAAAVELGKRLVLQNVRS
ncbi:MAG: cobalamin-dependent protein [Phycisphaerae bacterium]|nr:cobalamin-dependent protein [Phycisphaerae bacterium]